MLINKRMDKQNVTQAYRRLSISQGEKGDSESCYKTHETWGRQTQQRRPTQNPKNLTTTRRQTRSVYTGRKSSRCCVGWGTGSPQINESRVSVWMISMNNNTPELVRAQWEEAPSAVTLSAYTAGAVTLPSCPLIPSEASLHTHTSTHSQLLQDF